MAFTPVSYEYCLLLPQSIFSVFISKIEMNMNNNCKFDGIILDEALDWHNNFWCWTKNKWINFIKLVCNWCGTLTLTVMKWDYCSIIQQCIKIILQTCLLFRSFSLLCLRFHFYCLLLRYGMNHFLSCYYMNCIQLSLSFVCFWVKLPYHTLVF